MANKLNLDFDFPQVDLPSSVLAWHNITQDLLDLYKQACRLQACIFAICLKGQMNVSINLIDYTIRKGELITLFPGSIIQFKDSLSSIRLCFAGFSADTVSQVNLMEITTSSFHKIIEKPVVRIGDNLRSYLDDYFTLWAKLSNDESIPIPPEIIQYAMRSILVTVANIYHEQPMKPIERTRQEEIYRELLQLITQNYMRERTAQYYAERLKLTPQHLSTTVKQVTGGTVLDLIAHVVIMDAKAKLRSTNMSVQEIAYSLNFPTPSFFGKYFKRYVGMSPLTYKQKK